MYIYFFIRTALYLCVVFSFFFNVSDLKILFSIIHGIGGSKPCFKFVNLFWLTQHHADKTATKTVLVNQVGDFGLVPSISGRFTLFQTRTFQPLLLLHATITPKNSRISCNMRFNVTIALILGFSTKDAHQQEEI